MEFQCMYFESSNVFGAPKKSSWVNMNTSEYVEFYSKYDNFYLIHMDVIYHTQWGRETMIRTLFSANFWAIDTDLSSCE